MKVQWLGRLPECACYLFTFHDLKILLDCAIHMSQLTQLSPLISNYLHPSYHPNIFQQNIPFKVEPCLLVAEDLESIDVILISNHLAILALPFITEYSKFSGKVYATEGTLRIGRLFMEELLYYTQNLTTVSSQLFDDHLHKKNIRKRKIYTKYSSNPSPVDIAVDILLDDSNKYKRALYNKEDIANCISKIHSLSYDETIALLHGTISVTPRSSGFSIGSCNWVFQRSGKKIVYMSACSPASQRHPIPLNLEELRTSDIILMSSLSTLQPTGVPSGENVGLMWRYIKETVNRGGNVLIPVYPSGIVYDLLEYIYACLEREMNEASVHIFFISAVAEESLSYASVFSEWLCASKRTQVYSAKEPFTHQQIIREGKMTVLANVGVTHKESGRHVKDKKPIRRFIGDGCSAIVFASHPCLRFGPALDLLRKWGTDKNSTLILVEPDYPKAKVINNDIHALFPNQLLSMEVVECFVDPRLTLKEAKVIINETQPEYALLPLEQTHLSETFEHHGKYGNEKAENRNGDVRLRWYSSLEVLEVPIVPLYQKGYFNVALAKKIITVPYISTVDDPVSIRTYIARIRAILREKDSTLTLIPPEKDSAFEINDQVRSQFMYGSYTLFEILSALEEEGCIDAKIKHHMEIDKCSSSELNAMMDDSSGLCIEIPSLDATLTLKPHKTVIETDNSHSRNLLANIIRKHLKQL